MTKDNNRKKKIKDKKQKIQNLPNDLVQSKTNVHWFYAI